MEGNSVNRFKEILKVFTNYGLGYLLGKKEDNIESKDYSQYTSTFDDKLSKLFNGIPHYIYQGNPLEIVYVCPEES